MPENKDFKSALRENSPQDPRPTKKKKVYGASDSTELGNNCTSPYKSIGWGDPEHKSDFKRVEYSISQDLPKPEVKRMASGFMPNRTLAMTKPINGGQSLVFLVSYL